MKKSLIFWFAAVTCAAWILVGCEQEPETKTNTVTKYVAGDIPGLNKLLDEGVSPIRYVGDLEIATKTVVIPAGITVNVDDGVTISTGGLLGVAGTLTVGTGESIAANGGVIAASGTLLATVTGTPTAKAELKSTILEVIALLTTENEAAILNVNSSDLTSAITGGKTLYVLGDLTFNSAPAAYPIGNVKAYGNFVINNATVDFSTVTTVDISETTVKTASGVTAATLTLPVTAVVKAVDTGAGKLTIAGAGTSLTVDSLTGNLALPPTVAAVAINGGTGNVEGAALTTSGAVTLNNTGTTAFSGAVSLGGDLTVTGTATLGSTLTNTAAAVATFNGTTTVTNTVTTGTGGLTIGGTGAVTLTAAPTITNGLTVTNTTGVTIPSVTGVASKSIDASAGKVIFGTADNSVTIVKGTLTSGADGLASVAANGAVTLAYTSSNAGSLVLADEGSITFVGDGKLNVAAATPIVLSGGRFDNAGAVLTLTPGATAATATLTGTALTKLTLGAGATIAIPAEASTGLVLQGVIVDLSTAGSITIVENGVLKLGTATAGINYVAGIITKYNGTGSVVVAGGKESGVIATATNVTAFDSTADYDAIITVLDGAGVGVAGTITGGSGKNNTIDRNDTFALDTSSPALAVTSVAN